MALAGWNLGEIRGMGWICPATEQLNGSRSKREVARRDTWAGLQSAGMV